MYAYYEKNEMYADNLRYFLKYGIVSNIDYYIIINGKCTVEIPHLKNITVIHRENEGYDFGAWSHCIKYLQKMYDYYIFINSSVRGPYRSEWLHEFLELFDDVSNVKLVGTSINVHTPKNSNYIFPHVQSMFFILDSEAFYYLKNINFFNEDKYNKSNFATIVHNGEIEMSTLVLKNNWNINCILTKYRGYDYRRIKSNFNKHADIYEGDPYYDGAYFGDTIKPKDVIFFKMNRRI